MAYLLIYISYYPNLDNSFRVILNFEFNKNTENITLEKIRFFLRHNHIYKLGCLFIPNFNIKYIKKYHVHVI